MRTFTMCCVMLGVAVLALGAYGQNPPPQPATSTPAPAASKSSAHGEDTELEKLIEEVKAARLAKQLGLTDEETVVLLRRLSEFREQTQGLKKERQDIIKALKTALRDNRPDPETEAKLKELLDHDAKAEKLKKAAYEKLCANFSVSQRARLYVFLSEFDSDMRRLVQKARQRDVQTTRPSRNSILRPRPQTPEK